MAEQDARSGRVVIFQRDYGSKPLPPDEWPSPEGQPNRVLRKQLEDELLRRQIPLPSFVDLKTAMRFFAAVAVCDRIADESGIKIRAVLDYDEYTADIELAGIFLDIDMEDYLPHFGLILTQADRFWIEPDEEPPFTLHIRMPYFKDAYLCP